MCALDPVLDEVFARGTRVERVATGLRFTEGPAWIAKDRCLLFSDIPASRIYRLSEHGVLSVEHEETGQSNGLILDGAGRLVACEQGGRRITRYEQDGTRSVLADRYDGRRLNSPNDIALRSDGTLYFTDPTYGIRPHQQELGVQGVYRLALAQEPVLVAADFRLPNGLAFSPDEGLLYVDDSQARHIRVFRVLPDGALAGGEVLCDMNVPTSGDPDGITVDRQGRIYCAGPGGVWVIDPEGHRLGTIQLPEQPSNCTWGGPDLRTLYMTAHRSIYRVRARTGAPQRG